MSNLEKLEQELAEYFDKKTANFNFYNEQAVANDIDSLVEEALENVYYILEDADREVDKILQNFDSTKAREDYIRTEREDLRYEHLSEDSEG